MQGFKKMSIRQQQQAVGGNAFLLAAGLVATMFIKAVVSGISSYKMLNSNKGSVKIDGYESHWENKEPAQKHRKEVPTHFYVY